MTSVVVDAGERRPEIFSNNFWGKEEAGFEALTSRLREAKQTCEDVKNMFHERAIIEEEYAKKLMRISKITIGNDETGTLREALEVCRQELEATAKEHITLSQKIRTELEQDVTNFIARQKETRKLQQAIVEKSLRNKKEQTALVQKVKERYETECVKITGLLAGKNSIMGKDLEKLNLKIEKTQMAAKAADQEYAQLVKSARETTQKWNYDWRVACDKFQDLEEERVDSLKTYLWTYANLISTVCVADDESCERIRVALEHCNVEKDIQIFIRDRATGPDIPEPPNYVNFYEGPKENGISFKRASFNRVPAYIDGGTTTPLGPSRRLSLHELHSTYNSNSNAYHTRNDSGDYDNMNIERARLYANTTTLNTINNINNEEEVFEQIGEEEPVDPRVKQMLSIGDNVLEVETNKLVEQDEVAQALANMHLTTETNNITDNNSDQNLTSTITSTINSTISSTFEPLKKLPKLNTSAGGSISGEGNTITNRRPLPVNFITDKPQPPTPTDIQQQQQQQTILYHQRNNSQSRLQFNSYQLNGSPTAINPTNTSTAIINGNNSSTHSLHQQPQGGIINGPGDLRRQPSEQNNNGPVSSQQQQISQNMSMRSKSSQPNRDSQQQQGPGDIRRMSNTQPSPTNTGPTQVSQQQIPGQMIPQDQILTQGQRQIISQGITSSPNNSVNLNRSDTHRTTSTTSNNSTIGIQLDAHGRVKKDELAESFITNGGRLPPESAKFQTNPQGIPQTIQQQISSQGQISSFNRQLQQMSSNQPVISPQSSYRGPQQVLQQQQIQQQIQQQQQQQIVQQQQQIQQQIQQQQQQQQIVQQVLPQQVLQQPLHRANTLNSNSTLTSAFHHNQGVNANSQQLQDSLGIQLQTRPQVSVQQQQSLPGQQINYQDPSFYNPPTMAQYQRPSIGTNLGGGGAQGFQQMQHVQGIQQLQRQQSQLQSYSLQQPQQIMARSVQLQYQPLQRPVIAGHPQDNRPRTEDGKPIEFYVKALYDYQKTIPEEISFTAGDIIAVLNTHSDGWWEGEIIDESRRNRGLFPSNYIEVLH